MAETLVPIFVCVVLPVAIVLIIYLAYINADNQRAKVLIKAIEAGGGNLDVDRLAALLKKNEKTDRQLLSLRLLRGCMFSLVGIALCVSSFFFDVIFNDIVAVIGGVSIAIGLSYLIVWYVTRKQIKE